MKFLLYPIALAASLSAAHAAVQAPPLPPGSAQVRVAPGLSKAESERHVRAHHHKMHHKKDFRRDDSVPGNSAKPAGKK